MHSPEWHEKTEIKEHLKTYVPLVWYFSPLMSGYDKNGVPDIIGCHITKGFFGIEVKRPGKKPTPIQERHMQQINMAGGKTFWGTADKVIAEFEAWIS